MLALDKSDNRTWKPMTSFFMAATLTAILDHGPFFSEEAFMSLIRHWHVSSAWNNWYVSLLRPSNSKKLKLIFEFNFIHNHIFSKVVYAFHVTSSMNQGYFLLFGLLGRTKMTHYLYLWNECIFSLDSSSENPRRNTTLEILFSNYDKDVRPNQGGSYIRFVHQDYRRLNVLLKSFCMFPCNIITTQNILLVAY